MVEKIVDQIETVDGWDKYYYELCVAIAKNSKCFSRQIGAIIVKDKSIISTGYCGPPRGFVPCDERHTVDSALFNEYVRRGIKLEEVKNRCPRQVLGFKSGEGIEWCVSAHAEENAILNAARVGTVSLKNTKMYMSCGIPCSKCLIKIIQVGIEEIIVSHLGWYDGAAKYLLDNSGLKVRLFDFLEKKAE